MGCPRFIGRDIQPGFLAAQLRRISGETSRAFLLLPPSLVRSRALRSEIYVGPTPARRAPTCIGHEYRDAYFQAVLRRFEPGAGAHIQAIVIRDGLFERYAPSADFIHCHVFPGGMPPGIAPFERHAMRTGLRVPDRFTFGRGYAGMLRRWRAALGARLDDVRHRIRAAPTAG